MPENMLRGGFAFLLGWTRGIVEQLNVLWENQDLALRYGERGREYIQTNSDIDVYAEQISKLF